MLSPLLCLSLLPLGMVQIKLKHQYKVYIFFLIMCISSDFSKIKCVYQAKMKKHIIIYYRKTDIPCQDVKLM